MQNKDIERHVDNYEVDSDSSALIKSSQHADLDGEEIKSARSKPHTLLNDVVHFDLSCLEFLHKLGEGK